MPNYSFRIRFNLADISNINSDSKEIILFSDKKKKIILSSAEPDKTINKAKILVLKGSKFHSKEDAESASVFYQNILMLTLARLHIGSDFGNRIGRSGFFPSFLESLEKDLEQRILNDEHGVMVFKTYPLPKFARIPTPRFIRGSTQEKFKNIFKQIELQTPKISDKERISIELFNASFFVKSADARFICLVMAIECLIEPLDRNEIAQKHIKSLMQETKVNKELDSKDRISFLSSLNWLLKESIGQAGKRLVTERLGERKYNELTPARFFSKIYSLRSSLVHGNMPYPSFEDVAQYVGTLEDFVSDLIGYSTLD